MLIIKNTNELIKVKTEKGKTAWVCTICNYVYYGEKLPEDYVCPKCGAPASLFKKEVNLWKDLFKLLFV